MTAELRCNNLFLSKLKGLKLYINAFQPKKAYIDDKGYTHYTETNIIIPLSISALKCYKSLFRVRKYNRCHKYN